MKVNHQWRSRRLKYVVDRSTEKASVEPGSYYVGLENVEPWTGAYIRTEAQIETESVQFRVGDVLFGKLRPYLAKVHIAKTEGACSAELLALRPGPDVSAEFLFYRLISADFIDLVNSTTFGSKMPRADWEQIGSIRVAFPSLDEQARIVSILDLKTTEIDRSLERKQRLIELLDEKRAALISRAVTQGLDLGVPMKDTGVPWLGRCVPAHWEPIAIKFGLRALVDTEHKTAPFYPDGTFLVVRTSNIRRGALVLEDARYTDEEGFKSWTARGRPQAGDIMFTREAPAGEACIVPEGVDLCLGQRVVLMRLDPNALTSRFTLWALYGGISAEFVKLLSQGTTVAHFNMEDIKNIPLLRPPLEEQVRIASHIDREVVKLDQICAAARQSIELMIERRSVLITAAVTGQLDIRAHEKKMEALV